jgi:hypothetical protein
MVMGRHSQTIHDRSIEPHLLMIEREELRKRRLWSAEKWKEYSALLVSGFVFAVSFSETILMMRSFGLRVPQFSVNWKDGLILTGFISV